MTRTQKFIAQLPGLALAIGIAIVATAIGHFVPLVEADSPAQLLPQPQHPPLAN